VRARRLRPPACRFEAIPSSCRNLPRVALIRLSRRACALTTTLTRSATGLSALLMTLLLTCAPRLFSCCFPDVAAKCDVTWLWRHDCCVILARMLKHTAPVQGRPHPLPSRRRRASTMGQWRVGQLACMFGHVYVHTTMPCDGQQLATSSSGTRHELPCSFVSKKSTASPHHLPCAVACRPAG
jgi:hypothetical protein